MTESRIMIRTQPYSFGGGGQVRQGKFRASPGRRAGTGSAGKPGSKGTNARAIPRSGH